MYFISVKGKEYIIILVIISRNHDSKRLVIGLSIITLISINERVLLNLSLVTFVWSSLGNDLP